MDDAADPGVRRPAATTTPRRCGNFAVNTIQPAVRPRTPAARSCRSSTTAAYPNIGDRHDRPRASRGTGTPAAGTTRRPGHPGAAVPVPPPAVQLLRRLRARRSPAARTCRTRRSSSRRRRTARCRTVSFVKPYGAENEHPGYASEPDGSDHLVDLLKTITNGPQARTPSSSSPTTSSAASGTTSSPPSRRHAGVRAPASPRWSSAGR